MFLTLANKTEKQQHCEQSPFLNKKYGPDKKMPLGWSIQGATVPRGIEKESKTYYYFA